MSSQRPDGSINPKLSPEQLEAITGISSSDVSKHVAETIEDTEIKVGFWLANFPGNIYPGIKNMISDSISKNRARNNMRTIDFCVRNFEQLDFSYISEETKAKLTEIHMGKEIRISNFSETERAELDVIVRKNWKKYDLVAYAR